MKKNTVKSILAAAMLMFVPMASAAMDDFTEIRRYTSQFTDVPESAWYKPYVASSYQLGLFNGTDGTHFSPQNKMTNAQAVTLAARIHSTYNRKTIPSAASGASWAQPYADYARSNSIADNAVLTNLNANASRLSFAKLMANALPESEFAAINQINSIPDVAQGSEGADAVYQLYNAGVVTGSDKFGTFNPASNISRAEASAIIARMLDTSLRQTFTPVPRPDTAALLKNVSYYGDAGKCKMTPAMANAYAGVLDSLQIGYENYNGVGYLEAVLYDIADDGYPLLLTTYSGNVTMPVIWACKDGKTATDALANEPRYLRMRICKINGKNGIYTDYCSESPSAMPADYCFYSVQNGKVNKVYDVKAYAADSFDFGKTYEGGDLPGIPSDRVTKTEYSMKSAPSAEFDRAGWSKALTGTRYYYTVNGKKMDMSRLVQDKLALSSSSLFMLEPFGIESIPDDNYEIASNYQALRVKRWLPYQTVWTYEGDYGVNLMSDGLKNYAKAMQ